MVKDIEGTLSGGEFTVDAEKNQLRAAEDPLVRFAETPLLMLKAVRTAAELGIEFHKITRKAIHEKSPLLKEANAGEIRNEFEKIIAAEFAGMGLRMLIETKLLRYIIGDLYEKLSNRSMIHLALLMENIDKTKQIRERRLGLFYLCFEKKQALEAMKLLEYDAGAAACINDALEHLDSLCFVATKQELKQFMARRGLERYKYLEGLAKAQRIAYELPETKILSRHYLMQQIKNNGEPIFLEDLKITRDEIEENDIAFGKKAERIMEDLLELVHITPALNTNKDLLLYAKKFSRNPFASMYQKIKKVR